MTSTQPSTGCYYEGKRVRENHEWYIDAKSGGFFCRQCGARQANGSWLCVDCFVPLVKITHCIVEHPEKLRCKKCSNQMTPTQPITHAVEAAKVVRSLFTPPGYYVPTLCWRRGRKDKLDETH